MKHSNPKEVVQPTSLQQVRFNDGMIVTAEDLQDAAGYPLDVFKTLIRAFFGCGIVCGLKVKPTSADDTGKTWCVEVTPGVALDCHGHPIELCRSVKFDLNEAYLCVPKPKCVCIAIRRCTSEESPRSNSSCSGEKSGQECDCARIREHVMIKVFNPDDACDTPKTICMVDDEDIGCCGDGVDDSGSKTAEAAKAKPASSSSGPEDFCECIKSCSNTACCGDAWVLLACIQLDGCGVVCVENRLRKYVKPIHCWCPPEEKECVEKEKNTVPATPPPKRAPARKRGTAQK